MFVFDPCTGANGKTQCRKKNPAIRKTDRSGICTHVDGDKSKICSYEFLNFFPVNKLRPSEWSVYFRPVGLFRPKRPAHTIHPSVYSLKFSYVVADDSVKFQGVISFTRTMPVVKPVTPNSSYCVCVWHFVVTNTEVRSRFSSRETNVIELKLLHNVQNGLN